MKQQIALALLAMVGNVDRQTEVQHCCTTSVNEEECIS